MPGFAIKNLYLSDINKIQWLKINFHWLDLPRHYQKLNSGKNLGTHFFLFTKIIIPLSILYLYLFWKYFQNQTYTGFQGNPKFWKFSKYWFHNCDLRVHNQVNLKYHDFVKVITQFQKFKIFSKSLSYGDFNDTWILKIW